MQRGGGRAPSQGLWGAPGNGVRGKAQKRETVEVSVLYLRLLV